MYVKKLTKRDFKDVAKLESQVYPEDMCLGEKDYINDYDKVGQYNSFCYGAYKNGAMVGYIIAFNEMEDIDWGEDLPTLGEPVSRKRIPTSIRRESIIYVSDLVCTNKRAILPLLAKLIERATARPIVAELRSTSKRLIDGIKRRYPSVFLMYEEEKVEGYYGNEDAWKIRLKINQSAFKDDMNILLYLALYEYEATFDIPSILSFLQCKGVTLDAIEKHKDKILKSLVEKAEAYYSLMPKTLSFIIQYEAKRRKDKKEQAEKLAETIIKRNEGMKLINYANINKLKYSNREDLDLRNLDNTVSFCDGSVVWHKMYTIDNSKYNDGKLTYYRHILKKHILDYFNEKSKNVKYVYVLNEDGTSFYEIYNNKKSGSAIPYISGRIFDSVIEKQRLYEFIQKRLRDICGTNYIDTNRIISIKKHVGAELFDEIFNTIVNNILSEIEKACKRIEPREEGDLKEKIINETKDRVSHDILFAIYEICDYLYLLTPAAAKIVLTKTGASLMFYKDILNALNSPEIRKMDKKPLRKEISMCIKRGEDLKKCIYGIIDRSNANFLRKNKITKKLTSVLNDFMEQMRRYSTYANASRLFGCFGEKTIDVITGKIEGLFEPIAFRYMPKEVGALAKACLGNRGKGALVKHPKLFFSAIAKIASPADIVAGNIYGEDIDLVLNEIRQRNVDIPKEYYNLKHLYAKIEPKCSPEYLTAGDASVCCMSFGQQKATTYALEKGFGIFNIYYKDRVIANSVLWINELYNCLVLDNIEVHPNYIFMNDYIENLYKDMIEYAKEKYAVDFVVQGASYSDLELYKEKVQSKYAFPIPENNFPIGYIDEFHLVGKEISDEYFYSDAQRCYIVNNSKPIEEIKLLIKEKNDLLQEERKKQRKEREDIAVAPATFVFNENAEFEPTPDPFAIF